MLGSRRGYGLPLMRMVTTELRNEASQHPRDQDMDSGMLRNGKYPGGGQATHSGKAGRLVLFQSSMIQIVCAFMVVEENGPMPTSLRRGLRR